MTNLGEDFVPFVTEEYLLACRDALAPLPVELQDLILGQLLPERQESPRVVPLTQTTLTAMRRWRKRKVLNAG